MADGEDRPDDAAGETAEDDREWRFALSEVGPDAEDPGGDADDRIEAGDPTREGAAFVLLGIAFGLYVFSRLFVG